MRLTRLLSLAATALLTLTNAPASRAADAQSSTDVLAIIERVNDYWQSTNSPNVRAFWDNAAYFTGNMEAYRLTGHARYLDYADRWARHNQWQGAREKDATKWKYANYGEGQDYVLFGDWQICFQTYLDLYAFAPAPHKIARAIEVMSHECASTATNYWWWADALYMVMPVMTKLYRATGDVKYLDKLYANFCWADSLMFDAEAQLYYRDGKYIYPAHTTDAGRKDFWARGDGWVLAGLAKVLADMPADYCHRSFFEQRFRQLADGVSRCQQPEGYWTRSMLDPEQADGPETSGTAFFCYGLQWGVNHGLLSAEKFQPIADRAWNYLVGTALQADGSVGYVQPIGEKAIKGQQLSASNVANFGTGAFLLAACERVRHLDSSVAGGGTALTLTVSNPRTDVAEEVVELPANTVFQKLGIGGGRQFIICDARGTEMPYQLTHDGQLLVCPTVRGGSSVALTIKKGVPADYPASAYGRQYPERVDDIAWENDRCAFRLYGPALQRTGERAYGNDVWVKSTKGLVVEQRYHDETAAQPEIARLRSADPTAAAALSQRTSYHVDHGNGLDCYSVGPTLGCGTPALYVDGALAFPYCYTDYEILDNGPLRFAVNLIYAPTAVAGQSDSITEHRLVRLDRGSNFCLTTVCYDHITKPTSLAAGLVLHDAATATTVLGKNYVLHADPTDNPDAQNGTIFTAALFPASDVKTRRLEAAASGTASSSAASHAVGIKSRYTGAPYTYYFGAAWSKADCHSLAEWEVRAKDFLTALAQPLTVELK